MSNPLAAKKAIEDNCPDCHVRYDYDGERIVRHCEKHFPELCPGIRHDWTDCRGC